MSLTALGLPADFAYRFHYFIRQLTASAQAQGARLTALCLPAAD